MASEFRTKMVEVRVVGGTNVVEVRVVGRTRTVQRRDPAINLTLRKNIKIRRPPGGFRNCCFCAKGVVSNYVIDGCVPVAT